MKLLKIMGYVLLGFIIVAIAIPIALMIFVNPNQFKPQIQKEVQKVLHRPFVINGGLQWTVVPTAGIKAEDLAVGDLLTIKSIKFSVALQPLLHKEIRIGKVIIDGLNINLIKKTNGRANWEATDSSDQNSSTTPETSKKSTNSSSNAAVFSVSEIVIKNSEINYTDQVKNKYIKIGQFNFKSSQINEGKVFPVEISMKVTADNLAEPLDINTRGQFNFSMAEKKLNITNIYATVNDDLVLTGSKKVEFTNPIRWQANINLANIKIDHLLKLFKKNKLNVSGMGTVSADLQGSVAINDLKGNLKFEVKNGVFHGVDLYYYSNVADSIVNKVPPMLKDTHQTPFGDLTGTANIQNGVLNNKDLVIKADKVNAYGEGTANLNTQQLDYQLSLQRMTSGTEIKPRGPAVPLMITGDFSNPSIKLNVQSLLVSEVKQQIQDKVQEYAPQINQKIAEGLQSLLGK